MDDEIVYCENVLSLPIQTPPYRSPCREMTPETGYNLLSNMSPPCQADVSHPYQLLKKVNLSSALLSSDMKSWHTTATAAV